MRDVHLASCLLNGSSPAIKFAVDSITDSLNVCVNGRLHDFKFSLAEHWENLLGELLNKGSDSGFLAFTALSSFVLFISVVDVFNESFNSLSLDSDHRVSSSLGLKVSSECLKSVLNFSESSLHDSSNEDL